MTGLLGAWGGHLLRLKNGYAQDAPSIATNLYDSTCSQTSR